MTPTEISDLLDAHDKRRPVTAPVPRKPSRPIGTWLGIAGGVITVLGGFWMFGDGLFFTDAEAAVETAARIKAETKIKDKLEKDHGDDLADVTTVNNDQDTSIQLLRQSIDDEKVNAGKARARLEQRLNRHEQRGH